MLMAKQPVLGFSNDGFKYDKPEITQKNITSRIFSNPTESYLLDITALILEIVVHVIIKNKPS